MSIRLLGQTASLCTYTSTKTRKRTRLQYSHRQAIAGKLAQGVTTQHILDSIRDSVQGKFERIHYTTNLTFLIKILRLSQYHSKKVELHLHWLPFYKVKYSYKGSLEKGRQSTVNGKVIYTHRELLSAGRRFIQMEM